MTTELERMIEQARQRPPMTEEERRTQIISFAYGNTKMHNPSITKEMVAEEYDRLKALGELSAPDVGDGR